MPARTTIALGVAAGLAGFAVVVRGNPAGGLAAAVLDAWPAHVNLVAATLAGLAVARRVVPDAPRSLLLATGGGLGVGLLATLAFLLGAAGGLNAATAWGLVLVLGVAGGVDLARDRRRWERAVTPSPLLILPALGVGLAAGAAAVVPGGLWGGEPAAYDALSYHLQLPREWFELGRIAPADHNVFGRFPLANEVLFLLPMHQLGGPWAGQYAAQFTNVGLLAMAALAAHGAARGVGATVPAAGVAAAAVGTLPWAVMLGSVAYNEPLLILAATLTVAWIARGGGPRAAAVAGLIAGLAGAAKYTGIPVVVGGGVVALAVLSGFDRKRSAASVGTFVVCSLAFAGPWLVRNAVAFGNPVSPLAAGAFGGVDGWTADQIARWSSAHSLPATQSRGGQVWREMLAAGNYGYALWPLAAIGFASGLRNHRRAAVAAGVMLATTVLVWIAATHMIGRFLVAGVGPAAVLVALIPALRRRAVAGAVAVAISAVGVIYTLGFAGGFGEDRGLLRLTAGDRAALVGLPGPPTFLTPVEDFPAITGRDLYLVGDAEAWAYPHPAGRLHYKTVFDVPATPDPLRGWLGDALDDADPRSLVVIDPASLERFERTYGLPAPRLPVRGKTLMTLGQLRRLTGGPAASTTGRTPPGTTP